MVPNTTLTEQIKKLVELQKFDKEIFVLKKELEEKPVILKKIQDEFEGTKQKLHELEEKLKKVLVKRRDFELDLKAKEEQITKTNSQLSLIKTNKEYSAKLSEIENIKADKSIIEEKILLSFDEADAVNVEVDKEKQNVAEIEKLYLSEKKKIEDRIKEIQLRLSELTKSRDEIAPSIDKEHLVLYERIMKHKEGLGIVPVKGTFCSGCFMNVTQQMFNLLKMSEQLVRCETCSRILYVEDEN